ncbi:hypothetical protein JCM39194_22130 [Desulfotomaculum varum]
MKKIMLLLVMVSMLFGGLSAEAAGKYSAAGSKAPVLSAKKYKNFYFFADGVNVMIFNGKEIQMDYTPIIQNETFFLPVKYLAMALGIKEKDIKYSEDAIVLKKGSTSVVLRIDDYHMYYKKGSTELLVDMGVKPMIIDGVTYLPGSWVAFAFGCGTYWYGEDETWSIYY